MYKEDSRSSSVQGPRDDAPPQQKTSPPERQAVARVNDDLRRVRRIAVPDLLSDAEWSRLVAALRLAPQEAEVLRGAFYDEREEALADRLHLRHSTVHTYCERLRRKLDVASMTQVIAHAFAVYLRQSKSGSPREMRQLP